MLNRVIGFIDLDSFEVQIYLQNNYGRNWKHVYFSRPCILANATSTRIVSVSPLSKHSYGITRDMTVHDAEDRCGDLLVIQKECLYNKPESKRLRQASQNVLDVITSFRKENGWEFTITLEYSPSDEFYFDFTPLVNSIPLGHCFSLTRESFAEFHQLSIFRSNTSLTFHGGREDGYLYGAHILQKFRSEILARTGFYCSGAVAGNKIQAKFACNLHKPNGLTVLNNAGYGRLSTRNAIHCLKGLGGDLGQRIIDTLNSNGNPEMTISELQHYSRLDLQQYLDIDEHEADEVYRLCRGRSDEEVVERLMTKSFSAGKSNFGQPPLYVNDYKRMRYAFYDLVEEICDRILEDSSRHHRFGDKIQFIIELQNGSVKKFGVSYNWWESRSLRYLSLTNRAFQIFKENSWNGYWWGRVIRITLRITPNLCFKHLKLV